MKFISAKSTLMMLTGLLCAAVVLPACGKKEQKEDKPPVETQVEETTPVAEPTEAEKLQASCDGGAAADCGTLGMMYEKGEGGVAKDEAMALSLYNKGCEGGDAKSCDVAGTWTMKGGDDAGAFALYKKSCDSGYGEGCLHLGMLYEKGKGAPQDDNAALAAFKKACAAGVEKACEKEAAK